MSLEDVANNVKDFDYVNIDGSEYMVYAVKKDDKRITIIAKDIETGLDKRLVTFHDNPQWLLETYVSFRKATAKDLDCRKKSYWLNN